eukprot:244563-Rhodomonas_salina.2
MCQPVWSSTVGSSSASVDTPNQSPASPQSSSLRPQHHASGSSGCPACWGLPHFEPLLSSYPPSQPDPMNSSLLQLIVMSLLCETTVTCNSERGP